MNSRNRVLSILKHRKSDRFPVDGWFSKPIWEKIKKYFEEDDDEIILENLGIDFRPVLMDPAPDFKKNPEFLEIIGKGLVVNDYNVKNIDENIFEDEWGVKIKVDNSTYSWNYLYHPLEESLSLKDLKIPDLQITSRFKKVKEDIKDYKNDYMIYTGISTLFRRGWLLCGFAKFLELLILDRNFIERLLDKLFEFTVQEINMYTDLGVDIIQFLGDLGSEESLFLSPDIWRKIFKPRMRELIRNVKNPNVFYFLHSDGNIKEIIPDLIDIGINILNPIQPECMDPAEIKKIFGSKLTLHGTMSMQKTFVFGNPQEIVNEVDLRIKTCGNNGGLILAPANVLTNDVPIENIIAFYNYVKNFSTLTNKK